MLDIAKLSFPNSEQGHYRLTSLDYEQDYALAELNKDDMHAVSINHPVSLFFDEPGWLCFLDDIIVAAAFWYLFQWTRPAALRDGIGLLDTG